MSETRPTYEELEAGMNHLLQAPQDEARVELLVRRPAVGEREILERAKLDLEVGLVGDNWKKRGSSKTDDGLAHPGMQLTLMNTRVIQLVSGSKERWPLAGDQVFLDLDLSAANLPPGTRLQFGTAIIEVSTVPHTGCKKFTERFGLDASKFVGSKTGRSNNFRGIHAVVVQPGRIALGDVVKRIC